MHREASMISTGTRKSGKSHGSRYRAVAPSSTVDESLFGHKTAGAPTGSKKAVFSSRVSNRDLKSTAAAAGTEEHVGPVMVTKRDMSRMLGQSSVLTPEEAQQLRKTREEQRQLERRVANERKAS